MTVYWSSTRAPVHLFKQSYETPELAQHLTENACVDASSLACGFGAYGVNEQVVKAYQRRLGVRKISENNPRRKR